MTLKKISRTCGPPFFFFPPFKPLLFSLFSLFSLFFLNAAPAFADTGNTTLAEYPIECPAEAGFFAGIDAAGQAEQSPVTTAVAPPLVDTIAMHGRKNAEVGSLYSEGIPFELPAHRFASLNKKVEQVPLEEPPIVTADYIIPEFTPPDITRVSTDERLLAVTFDGGSEDGDAPEILDALTERGIKATIFLTGEFIRKHPDTVRRIVADGHEVGNHTMNHPHLTDFNASYRHRTLPGVDRNLIGRELRGTAKLFKQATGKEMTPLWRAPYGEMNADIRRWAFEEGYVHIGWTYDNKRKESLDTLDWVSDRTSKLYRSSYEIKRRILNFGGSENGAAGGIVLMHLGTERKKDKASTVLGEILDALHERGYRFVTVSELLGDHKTLEAVHRVRKEKVMRGMVRRTEEWIKE